MSSSPKKWTSKVVGVGMSSHLMNLNNGRCLHLRDGPEMDLRDASQQWQVFVCALSYRLL